MLFVGYCSSCSLLCVVSGLFVLSCWSLLFAVCCLLRVASLMCGRCCLLVVACCLLFVAAGC